MCFLKALKIEKLTLSPYQASLIALIQRHLTCFHIWTPLSFRIMQRQKKNRRRVKKGAHDDETHHREMNFHAYFHPKNSRQPVALPSAP